MYHFVLALVFIIKAFKSIFAPDHKSKGVGREISGGRGATET